MRRQSIPVLTALSLLCLAQSAVAAPCQGRHQPHALGVSRTITVDTRGGGLYGRISTHHKSSLHLRDKEVVLTFDDGPLPRITRSILATLERYCVKATFFPVGRMALTYPETLKDILRRGHTLGSHTWSHPLNIAKRDQKHAISQIERGFSTVAAAAGQPIAPFFRFPGLSDSRALLDYLAWRNVASFTVDIISNDSFTSSASTLTRRTLKRIESRGGGIVLFHDIKSVTAKALPQILAGLKKRGYSIVHLRAATTFQPLEKYSAPARLALARAKARSEAKRSASRARLISAPGLRSALTPDGRAAAQQTIKLKGTLKGWSPLIKRDNWRRHILNPDKS